MGQQLEEMESRFQAENQVARNALLAEMSGNVAVEQYRKAYEQHFHVVVGELKKAYTQESERNRQMANLVITKEIDLRLHLQQAGSRIES